MEMSDDAEWKDVASRLAGEVDRLRRHLLGLAEVLPPEYLPYLDAAFDRDAGTLDPLDGWDETAVEKSDVIKDLQALWQRLAER
jgi:hypothetical protein